MPDEVGDSLIPVELGEFGLQQRSHCCEQDSALGLGHELLTHHLRQGIHRSVALGVHCH